MQDCPDWRDLPAVAHLTMRWCPTHQVWIVAAWAKRDGDSPFVEVHPMWLEPRAVADDDHANGTLQLLLTAAQRTVRRLADDAAAGQMTLW